MRAVIIALALCTIGCGHKTPPVVAPPIVVTKIETVEKAYPVQTPIDLPPELLLPLPPPPFRFIAPSDPKATSALDPEGERGILAWIVSAKARYDALVAAVKALMAKDPEVK